MKENIIVKTHLKNKNMKTLYGLFCISSLIVFIIALTVYFMDGVIIFGIVTLILQNAYYNSK